MSFAKNFGSKYGKKIMNTASKFNQIKYGKMLKKEGTKVGKLACKQLSGKIIPAAVDILGSKIADKINSLKFKDEEPQEQEEIIIPPEKRQQIINDLRLF